MAEQLENVKTHWTREGVLARIDAVLTELGHNPEKVSPEILASVEHLHSGGLATTQDQAKTLSLTSDSRVLDIGCGIGGPARYLARTYNCRVDGIDLTPELVETGDVLTKRCGLDDRVTVQIGDALDLSFADQTFDVVWCQNVTMNIADKAGFLAGVFRVLKPGGLFTSTEFSLGPGGDIIYPVTWAYDASINFLDHADVMRAQFETAGFRIRDWTNYSDISVERQQQTANAPSKLANHLVFGEDAPERGRNGRQNLVERRLIYWMITAERP